MRFIVVPLPPALPHRWHQTYRKRIAGLVACRDAAARSTYIKSPGKGSWSRFKYLFEDISAHKCWYCEAKDRQAPLDVDHYRPKLGVTAEGVAVKGHSGYWWLAYSWMNFRLSCQRCNRPERVVKGRRASGKANEFSVRDEKFRCTTPKDNLKKEAPQLLDPCIEADCQLLAHPIDGEVKPSSEPGTWPYKRADYTIKQLGLNEWEKPEYKRKEWRKLDDLIRLVGNEGTVVAHLREHLSAEQEYSSFFRAAIGSHRDKTWVEALL